LFPFSKQLPSLGIYFCNVKPLLQVASFPQGLFPQVQPFLQVVVFFLDIFLCNIKLFPNIGVIFKPLDLKEPLRKICKMTSCELDVLSKITQHKTSFMPS
jgi:hypothetical protein